MLLFKNNAMPRCLAFMLQHCLLENGHVKTPFYNICHCWHISPKEHMLSVDAAPTPRITVNRRATSCIFFLNVISSSLFVWWLNGSKRWVILLFRSWVKHLKIKINKQPYAPSPQPSSPHSKSHIWNICLTCLLWGLPARDPVEPDSAMVIYAMFLFVSIPHH